MNSPQADVQPGGTMDLSLRPAPFHDIRIICMCNEFVKGCEYDWKRKMYIIKTPI